MDVQSTRQRILIEAEKQFIAIGIANAQMKDIASAVNINRRTLYRYFPTKDELAFEIEILVMKQIQDYLTLDIGDMTGKAGFEKVKAYFYQVDLDKVKEQIKFTAEFDRYFQGDYPNSELEQSFIEALNPEQDPLYQYIREGVEDGSIRNDMTVEELYHFISHSFISLFQRLILRENHLKHEYCDNIDFHKSFRNIMLSGIQRT
ncbi:TetR/AcrR family transcriptional regulator [Paenibacillus sp. N1-5-1-14]|uniref:TetR/AcrR family transcriptional regulator n=1 Tax=Paenibacillus radicibacter TaxID=2972488 RepID=UPI002158D6E9|nr:TetR/AcrR family transcriptional regulator [Paenibacillus radicibacter]MCR8643395.1 TetR/AcrR family transcriptional regulator [Paenibacillus radicibacter]